jgi:hypothetical protein
MGRSYGFPPNFRNTNATPLQAAELGTLLSEILPTYMTFWIISNHHKKKIDIWDAFLT